MKVVINGVGVAGPTLAWWLTRSGHEVTLVEREPALRAGGYVVDFWGVGYDVAERMGLVPRLLELGYQAQEVRFVDRYEASTSPDAKHPLSSTAPMPRYRPFSESETGATADSARAAEALQRDGDLSAAIRMLERALAAGDHGAEPNTSGWMYGRLATLYRRVGRLEDEVDLLERFYDSHEEDEWRFRFNARLFKARTLLSRSRKRNSGVLSLGNGATHTGATRRDGRRSRGASKATPPIEPLPDATKVG